MAGFRIVLQKFEIFKADTYDCVVLGVISEGKRNIFSLTYPSVTLKVLSLDKSLEPSVCRVFTTEPGYPCLLKKWHISSALTHKSESLQRHLSLRN